MRKKIGRIEISMLEKGIPEDSVPRRAKELFWKVETGMSTGVENMRYEMLKVILSVSEETLRDLMSAAMDLEFEETGL